GTSVFEELPSEHMHRACSLFPRRIRRDLQSAEHGAALTHGLRQGRIARLCRGLPARLLPAEIFDTVIDLPQSRPLCFSFGSRRHRPIERSANILRQNFHRLMSALDHLEMRLIFFADVLSSRPANRLSWAGVRIVSLVNATRAPFFRQRARSC